MKFYTQDDVVRWEAANSRAIALREGFLANPPARLDIDTQYASLGQAYSAMGLTAIAQSKYQVAFSYFAKSTASTLHRIERMSAHSATGLEAGHFQSLLLSLVTKDEYLISELAHRYLLVEGPSDSIYLGRVVKALALRDNVTAQLALSVSPPRIDSQFRGFVEVLKSIAHSNNSSFTTAMNAATIHWATWTSKKAVGLPQSVCFILGVGLVRLAERVFNSSLDFSTEHVPATLLDL